MNIVREKSKENRFISIRRKILIVCICVIGITLTITGYISHLFVREKTQQNVKTFDRLTMEAAVTQLDNFFHNLDLYYYQIIVDSAVERFIFGEYGQDVWESIFNTADIKKSLLSHMGTVDYIHSLAVIRYDENIVCSNTNLEQFFAHKFNEEWKKQMNFNSELLTEPYRINTQSMEEVYTYIKTIYNINDYSKVQGYVLINIRSGQIDDLLKGMKKTFDYIELMKGEESYYLYSGLSNQALQEEGNNQYVYYLESYPLKLRAFHENRVLKQELRQVKAEFIVFSLAAVAAAVLILMGILSRIVKPIDPLVNCVEEIGKNNLEHKVYINTRDEFKILGDSLNRMSERLKGYSEKEKEHQLTEMNMEYGILMAQITPHFIYNALNSIKYLAMDNQSEQIHRMVNSLIRLLQDSIRMGEEKVFTTIGNEIEIAKYYCSIQQIIYPGRFEFVLDVEEEILDCKAPKTIIQPLVENSIIHGIVPSGRKGTILVKGYRNGDNIMLEVCDTGRGIDEEAMKRIIKSVNSNNMRHIGMANIMKRIEFIYSGNAEVVIDSNDEFAACIRICLPMDE